MHIHKFAKRIVNLADTPEAVQRIVATLDACIATQQVTHKDIAQLARELRALGPQKPQLHAPQENILPTGKYEFIATDVVGLEVIEGDRRYKRTLMGDIDKLLQ